MGYYTNYNLRMEPPNLELLDLIISGNEDMDIAMNRFGETQDSVKWYEWEEDMRKVSELYPDYLFHLSGEGENNDDIWEATFKAGKAHIRKAEINIPPFDEKELK